MKPWLFFLLIPLLLLGCQQPKPTSTPVPETFSDSAEMLQVRFALISHLVQVENITAVPLPPAWEPQQSHKDNTNRVYTFRSGDWQLDIEQPLQENPNYRYRTLLTGPDDFRYAADITSDSLVFPAQ